MISNAGESRKHGPGRQGGRDEPGLANAARRPRASRRRRARLLRGEIRGIGLSDDPGLQRIDDLPVDQAGIELAERPRDPRCPVIEAHALGSLLSASAGSSGQSPAAASSSLCACGDALDDRSSDCLAERPADQRLVTGRREQHVQARCRIFDRGLAELVAGVGVVEALFEPDPLSLTASNVLETLAMSD